MPLSLEQSQRLEYLRSRMLADQITREEELEAFTILRQDRVSASIASAKSRTAKAEAARPVDTKSLLASIGQAVHKRPEGPAPAAGSFKL